MSTAAQNGRSVRFGVFEVDPRSGEIRRRGAKLKLQEQPFSVLLALLERPGEVVSREELRKRVWPANTFVGFEHGLATAVSKIREALGDSATSPRFVETLPRRGYRFIFPVQEVRVPPLVTPVVEPSVESLAVLPFENDCGPLHLEYLSDGLTDSVIVRLSQLVGVRVMARATVFRYKGKEADPLAIGRELNVDAVLLGRVSERSGHLLIGVELVEARKGWHLWGEKYSRDAADLSTVEGELAADICRKLHVKLTGEQQRRMVRRPTADPRAYWDYLKGRYYANKLTAEGLERGIDYFQEAIREDPDCALAHAGLAASYNLIGFFGLLAPRQVFQKARAAARRALELDDGLAEAHAVMASVRKVCDWDWAGAQAGYRRALELNPNYATAHHWYADFLSAMGRCEEALAEIQLAQELDPLSLLISVELAWNSYMARQFDRSLDHALKTLEMEAALPAAHLVRGLACEQKGRWEEAIEAFGQARDGSGGNPATLAGLGHALARTGHGQEARVILDQLAARRQRGYASPYCSAIVAAGLGDADRALQLLEDAYDQHDFWLVWLAREPRLDGIHSDRRFRNLLARIGLS